MSKRWFRLPSPALVISMLALALVLGGTAVAATKSVHGDKAADVKLIKKLAPTLSVKKAKNADKLGGAPASAYARATPLSFTAPTLLNSWTAAGGFVAPGYAIDQFGTVHLRGAVLHAGASSDDILTLPAGLRPSGAVDEAAAVYGPAAAVIKIETDGTVHLVSGTSTFVDLDGVSFTTAG